MIRLFLVDDHTVLRAGLRALFQQHAELQVVGEAENGAQLLAQMPSTPCDVVLLDLHMPELDGLATTQRLHAEFPDVRVLILSMADDALAIGQVLAAGARGYAVKNAGYDELLVAVRAVTAGKRFLCSALGLPLLEQVLAGGRRSPLSPRTVSRRGSRKFCGWWPTGSLLPRLPTSSSPARARWKRTASTCWKKPTPRTPRPW